MKRMRHFRRISFGFVFVILCFTWAFAAVRADSTIGAFGFGWISLNALLLSFAYFINWPGVFGKGDVGAPRWFLVLLMSPALLFTQVAWQLQNIISRTPIFNEVAPGLYVGRRCAQSSLPSGVIVVVDLTAEFLVPLSLAPGIRNILLPTLDGCPPSQRICLKVLEEISTNYPQVYVCCANGHGRSVTFMAALLGQIGKCHTSSEALRMIQSARPTASPNSDQVSFLDEFFQYLSLNTSSL